MKSIFKEKNILISLYFLFILLIFYRSPCLLLKGRFHAEEKFYYEFALNNTFLETIFFVQETSKYFELFTNISAKLATFYTIAPFLVTVYLAFFIKIFLLYYIFFSKSLLLNKISYKLIFASFAIYSTPITPEVWLNTLHSKTFFGIYSFILVFQNFKNFTKIKLYLYRISLVINGLSSIYSSIFSVIYFIIFITKRNSLNFYNFIYSLIPLVINAFIFLNFFLQSEIKINRFLFNYEKIESALYNIIIRPILGGNLSKLLYNLINLNKTFLYAFSLIAIILFLALILFFIYKKKDRILNIILISLLLNIIFVISGSLYPDFVGGRYAVLSGVIFLTIFIRLIQIETKKYLINLYSSIILISLIIGLLEFKYLNSWLHLLKC